MFQPKFRTIHQPDDAPCDLYWITHAGGGTNTLAHRMRTDAFDAPANVMSPWMPGREEWTEVGFDGDLEEMSQLLSEQILADRKSAGRTTPFAVVGHSFGSILAYRITCRLVDQGASPHRLVVLSFPSPDDMDHQYVLHELSDEELVRQVDSLFGGIPANILDDAEAQAYFVPALRFDLGLLEQYRHLADATPLPVPITAICGVDDPAMDLARMNGWQRMTAREFRLRWMPGDHFFPLSRMPEILQAALWDGVPG